jgi:hypothetical protein
MVFLRHLLSFWFTLVQSTVTRVGGVTDAPQRRRVRDSPYGDRPFHRCGAEGGHTADESQGAPRARRYPTARQTMPQTIPTAPKSRRVACSSARR